MDYLLAIGRNTSELAVTTDDYVGCTTGTVFATCAGAIVVSHA
jgi:hypothetical protein